MSGNQRKEEPNQKPVIPTENGNPDCPVCLSRVRERAYTNSCLHEFCYTCIREWSRTHNRCPVCREVYRKILHNIRSANEYDELEVQEPINPEVNGMVLQMGGVSLIVTPQHTGMYVINPVISRTGTQRHHILYLGPGQTVILRNMSPNMVVVAPERLEDSLRQMNARPHYPHHGRHPNLRHRPHPH